MPMMINRRQFVLGSAAAAMVARVQAQAPDWPARPIHWIVPYLAATGPDMTVRIVAEAMSALLKQPIIIDNKAGAAGNLGAQLAARAPADGYTWVYSATTMASSMRMYRKPGFDVMKDFAHLGRIASSDLVLVTNAASGIASIQELARRARAHPGKLTYASGGIGTPAHLGAELILHAIGAQALHVPYKGASESVNALIGKQVDFALAISSVALPFIASGQLKALAVTGSQRNPQLAQVPTLAEAGVAGVTLQSFGGLSVPRGTPEAVERQVTQALAKVLAMPDVRARLEEQGGVVAPSTPAEYAQGLQSEIGQTEKMMKLAGLTPQ